VALQQELDEDVQEAEEAKEAVPSTVPDQVIHQLVLQWATKAGYLCHCKGRNGSCFDCSNDQHIEWLQGFAACLRKNAPPTAWNQASYTSFLAMAVVNNLAPFPLPPSFVFPTSPLEFKLIITLDSVVR